MNFLAKDTKAFQQICDNHYVDKMYLFGSATNTSFSNFSDIDLLVRFKPIELSEYFDNYIDLIEKLQSLFGRKIDLLEEQTLKNPILIKSIDQSKELIYG